MFHYFISAQVQVGNTISEQANPAFFAEVIEPLAATIATLVVILITFYMSNLKHDMLDGSLQEKQYKLKRKKVYTKLLRLMPLKIRMGILRN
jgi:hypothetical protein